MKRVLARLRAELPRRQMEELAVALTVMADVDKRRRGLRDVIVPLLSEEIVMESWVYKQGEQKGIEKGIEKGRTEGLAELLLAQLAAKFGPVSTKVRARVRKAGPAELTAWGTRVLTATTVAEALAPLAAPSPSPRSVK